MLSLTACALGLKGAWREESGHEITWIGVSVKIRWVDKLVFLDVPAKMVQAIFVDLETSRRLRWWACEGCGRLRAGSLNLWGRGLRWAAYVVYIEVTAAAKDVAEGIEEQRRKSAFARPKGLAAFSAADELQAAVDSTSLPQSWLRA